MRAYVVGNATLDVVHSLDRLPKPGETLLCSRRVAGPGGKGLNQAAAAARAGASVRFHAPIGDDEAGRTLENALVGEPRLETRFWRRRGPSDESSIWVGEKGENMIVSTADCARSVTPAEAVAALAGAAPGDWLAMQGNLPGDTTAAALAAARAKGVSTLFNPAPFTFDPAPMIRDIDVLVANRVEAAMLGEGEAALAAVLGRALIVTLGAEGARVVTPAGAQDLAAEPVNAIDATGAGDAFAGALLAALVNGSALDAAAALANKAGALATLSVGAFAPAA
ncbi:MAG: PfkB family carbohydrate kinase [Pseudomonadota bacterium]